MASGLSNAVFRSKIRPKLAAVAAFKVWLQMVIRCLLMYLFSLRVLDWFIRLKLDNLLFQPSVRFEFFDVFFMPKRSVPDILGICFNPRVDFSFTIFRKGQVIFMITFPIWIATVDLAWWTWLRMANLFFSISRMIWGFFHLFYVWNVSLQHSWCFFQLQNWFFPLASMLWPFVAHFFGSSKFSAESDIKMIALAT